jgi:hypothetical protein
MSLATEFTPSATPPASVARRAAPFSIRFSAAERARLVEEAAGAPLGTSLKAKALGEPIRARRVGPPVQDQAALARVLALLGRSHLSSNLSQLAKAVHSGSLPLTPETEAELLAAIQDVREIRALLMRALQRAV